jgi:general secretion pathway protein B
MSFILDALKKSESERQRQVIPGLVESGAARPRARLPMWAIGIGALLAVNLLVLLVVLARGWLAAPVPQTVQLPTARSRGADAAPVRPAPAASDHFSPLDSAPVYAPEIPVTGSATAAAPAQQAVVPRPLDAESAGVHPLHRRDPVLSDEDSKTRDEEVLPTINEISLTGAQSLPEMHLDVHVFATKASDRFVYINMRKYHEGATLQEGPTLERIRRDGVILSYQGLRFLLPRQ